ncbi:major facilitator superfamily protein, putative [Ichthyophthirius multifiliis]|uniref:Major facilitator superfamily protein, putative n=1 Tax=Ichthyophthirius multifiliis TaxID=5932 RepID=G0QMU6_ICHMU|nr:major facilitator superfamily protein, putative [Ichthyophthirius multifiliis]EGR33456.1 major facilitator superfamily protein, putative [Ichthyophthirius multifiliis]|eukprot:XP_004037442.1 major facilitator superfamily protein, putative [Ichthyophthirius multifiliis]
MQDSKNNNTIEQNVNTEFLKNEDIQNKDEQIQSQELIKLEEQIESKYKVYKLRYFIIIIFILGMLQISMIQNSFSPQAAQLIIVYKKSNFIYNLTSLIHMIVHVPMSFPANFVVEKYGTKIGNTICCFFALLSCWTKCLINYNFNYAILGQFFVGCANPFMINSISKFSCNWFYPSQRAAVTSLLSFFSTVSGIIGLLIPGIFFSKYDASKDNQETFQEGKNLTFNLLLVQAIVVSVFAVLNIIFYRDKPLTPPSYSANVQREDFQKSLKLLVKNKTYILITITFSLLYGSFIDFAVILGQVIAPFGFGSRDTSIMSLICVMSGIIGSIVLIQILKKNFQYKRLMGLCIIFCILSDFMFYFMLKTRIYVLVVIPEIILGFFIIPIVPILLEFANEVCFPVGEAIISGFLYSIAHVVGFLLGSLFSLIIDTFKNKEESAFWCVITFASIFILSFITIFFMKQSLNRTNAEKNALIQSSENISSSSKI